MYEFIHTFKKYQYIFEIRKTSIHTKINISMTVFSWWENPTTCNGKVLSCNTDMLVVMGILSQGGK